VGARRANLGDTFRIIILIGEVLISVKRKIAAFVVCVVALVALFLVAVNTGSLKVAPAQLISGLFVAYDPSVATIFDLRFPRIFIAMLGGAATATSGMLLQAVLKNPLADPGIIGISSGASLIAVLITAFAPGLLLATPLFAFLGGMLAFLLVYSLSWKGGLSPLRIILVGVAVNACATGIMDAFDAGTGSAMSGVASIVDANITMKTWSDFKTLLVYSAIGLVAALVAAPRCNLLALNDKTAQSLGVNVGASRIVISVVAVLLASGATAIVGPISFLGLIVPHIARLLVGSNHKVAIPFTMVLGAFVFLLADTIGRTIAAPYEISASVIMAVVGGPFFIFLLRRSRQNYGE
jgi:iron complex transport system permease protein